MKILLTIFVLFFSSSLVAQDISDYEIEGIRIGDTLLQYMTKEDILSNEQSSNQAYTNLGEQIFFEVYSDIPSSYFDMKSFFVKSNDNNFIIYAIYAIKSLKNNINECSNELTKIRKIYDKVLKNIEKINERVKILYDPSGKSYIDRTVYIFKNGDRIALECYDFDESFQKNQTFTNNDSLSLSFNKKELYLWINPTSN